jgi:pantothenate kinase
MIASSFGKLQHIDNAINCTNKDDISRSLLTMVSVNTLMLSKNIAKLENIKNVVWIGVHIDILEYM